MDSILTFACCKEMSLRVSTHAMGNAQKIRTTYEIADEADPERLGLVRTSRDGIGDGSGV
jgi:hypothetical protein